VEQVEAGREEGRMVGWTSSHQERPRGNSIEAANTRPTADSKAPSYAILLRSG
jgi:hypothetical protein